MKNLAFLFAVVMALPTYSQYGKKTTTDKNSMFISWGYNRSWYTDSDIRFKGDGYDFTLAGATASDRPSPFSFEDYFGYDKITIPQYNFRIGYYFKKNWSASIAFDHFKYVLDDGNRVKLYGNIDPGVDTVTNLSGEYSGQEFTTEENTFHYENTNGMNYIRLALERSYPLLKSKKSRKFGITGMLGGSGGVIVSVNDFTFAGKKDYYTTTLSGFGMSVHANLRFVFWDHLFLQPSVGAGYVNQMRVGNRPFLDDHFASQQLAYVEYNIQLGWLFKVKGKDDCDCPKW